MGIAYGGLIQTTREGVCSVSAYVAVCKHRRRNEEDEEEEDTSKKKEEKQKEDIIRR